MTRTSLRAAASILALSLPVAATAQVTTDAGTIDPAADGAVLQPARLFALCRPRLPDAPALGRTAPAHLMVGRRHRRRHAGRPRRGAAIRQGRARSRPAPARRCRLSRPYDWMVVTDHSDAMGVMTGVLDGDPALMTDPILKDWNRGMNAGGEEAAKVMIDDHHPPGRGHAARGDDRHADPARHLAQHDRDRRKP